MKAPSVLALALVLATPAAASADWFITPFIGLKFAGDTNLVDLESGASNTKLTLGAIVGWIDPGLLGFEADVGYSPRFFERSSGALVARSHVITVMGNFVLSVPQEITGDSLRPFVSGGAGWMRIGIDDVAGLLPVKSNLFGINVGGGATGRLTDVSSLRFELRYFKSITNDEEAVREGTSLSFWRAGVGLTLRY
jgi:Outer membrane protein beta-barrel domain